MCQTPIANTAYQKRQHCKQEVGVIWVYVLVQNDLKAKWDARRRLVASELIWEQQQQASCTSPAAAYRPLRRSLSATQVRDWMYFLHMGGNCKP